MKQKGIPVTGVNLKKNPDGRVVLAKSSGKALTLTQRMAKRARDKKPKYGKERI